MLHFENKEPRNNYPHIMVMFETNKSTIGVKKKKNNTRNIKFNSKFDSEYISSYILPYLNDILPKL